MLLRVDPRHGSVDDHDWNHHGGIVEVDIRLDWTGFRGIPTCFDSYFYVYFCLIFSLTVLLLILLVRLNS